MARVEIFVPKVWRSEIRLLVMTGVLSIVSIILSKQFPVSVVHGELFHLGGTGIELSLPLFWLLPATTFLWSVLRMYDVQYVLDSRGLESRVGILGLNRRITFVRYDDIRSAETEQTILERLLNIGNVEAGTAGTSGIEIVFAGVSAPLELKEMIQRERDRHLAFDSGAAAGA